MNMQKALLLTLIVAIVSLGLALTGCEQKSDHPTGEEHPTTDVAPAEHPAAEQPTAEKAVCPKCGEAVGSDACCMTKAAKEAAEKAVCPKCGEAVGSDACCMTKAAKEAAEKAGEAAEKAVDETKEAVEKVTEHPTGEHPK